MKIFSDKLIVIPLGVSVALILISLFVGLTSFGEHSGELIVNYNADGTPISGDDKIISVVGILALIAALNSILIYELYKRERLFSYALSFINVVLALLVLLAIRYITALN